MHGSQRLHGNKPEMCFCQIDNFVSNELFNAHKSKSYANLFDRSDSIESKMNYSIEYPFVCLSVNMRIKYSVVFTCERNESLSLLSITKAHKSSRLETDGFVLHRRCAFLLST